MYTPMTRYLYEADVPQMKKRKTNSRISIAQSWYARYSWLLTTRILTLIQACDNVLNSVEVSLTSFQKDLGAVSAEIETLQSRSTALNTRLENRKVVEKLLGPAVEEISIAPQVVKTITEGSIDHNWIKALEDLEKRSKVIDDKMKGSDQILAVTDVKPLLNDLTNKVRLPRTSQIHVRC